MSQCIPNGVNYWTVTMTRPNEKTPICGNCINQYRDYADRYRCHVHCTFVNRLAPNVGKDCLFYDESEAMK